MISVVKRNGVVEPLNLDKLHRMVEFACDGLAGVSESAIEMNSNLQFYENNKQKVRFVSGGLPSLGKKR